MRKIKGKTEKILAREREGRSICGRARREKGREEVNKIKGVKEVSAKKENGCQSH